MLRRAPAALSALAVLAVAAPAAAQAPPQTIPAEPGPGLTTPCGGRAIAPDQVITGEFGTNVNKDYVLLPFDVPAGTTAVRVKYCWDRPESGTHAAHARPRASTSRGEAPRSSGASPSSAAGAGRAIPT